MLAVAGASALAAAQSFPADQGAPPDWFYVCTDPANTAPVSNPYLINVVANELFLTTLGGGGTWAAGGSQTGTQQTNPYVSPCFSPPIPGPQQTNNSGKFAFSYGAYFPDPEWNNKTGVGSIQQYSPNFKSANLALNFGAPIMPSYCFANLVVDGSFNYFGSGFTSFFKGFSNRYMWMTQDISSMTIRLQIESVADAARFRWEITNDSPVSHQISLWFGTGINMLTDEFSPGMYPNVGYLDPRANGIVPAPDASGFPPDFNGVTDSTPGNPPFGPQGATTGFFRVFREQVKEFTGLQGYDGPLIYIPTIREPDTDFTIDKTLNRATWPDYIDFLFGESDPFGFRFETKPSASTTDVPANTPTQVQSMDIGKAKFVIGDVGIANESFPDALVPDTGFRPDFAFIEKFVPVTVNANATGQILNYVRSNWGNANYALPYGAVVDAPHLVQVGAQNYDGTASVGGLVPNPMKIRVWVDDVGGYAFDGKEFDLNQIQVKLTFDNPEVTVTSLNPQIIPHIAAHDDGFVDFTAKAGPDVTGNVNYTITINPTPTAPKTINGTITFSARPRLTLHPGANLIAAPFVFANGSWQTILSPFVTPNGPGTNIQTYTWDPQQQGYDIGLTNSRTDAAWAVYTSPVTATENLGGTPTTPPGYNGTTVVKELKPGWNLISSPFNIPFPISLLNGVSAADPENAHTFPELVSLGFVSNFIAAWDPVAQTYTYTDGSTGLFQPNRGYWFDVTIPGDLTLSFPPLFAEGAPQSDFKKITRIPPPTWKVLLAARTTDQADMSNYFGVSPNALSARQSVIPKAPLAPTQKLELALLGTVNGRSSYMKESYLTPASSYSWNAVVSSQETGNIELGWSNIGSIPSNMSVVLVDQGSGVSVDMRANSRYTYTTLTPGTRKFQIIVKPQANTDLIQSLAASRMIGVVEVDYALSTAATATLRVLDSHNNVVNLIQPATATSAGPHHLYWNAKDSRGNAVAKGIYTIQCSAVTPQGTQQTKVVTYTVQ